MTYLALARKWRPRFFEDVAGQAHVVRALENALDSGRVHHAFLFTGTRGVGKTTIARILAKALNCERGVSSRPCGECRSCIAVDEGRFVDLIEVDAASRTGVDDTRELLDNVQYTPSGGRFKVYLIDEVHMLSRQSFNALLKTLEEPPPHVKFIFATTDPQKIPVTVLSRCLQFNLKRLSRQVIAERVSAICNSEQVSSEPGALTRLATAAAGSMRDALSLLDQALAYGNGRLADEEVAAMLGSLDRGRVLDLVALVLAGDGQGALDAVAALDEYVPDYEAVLGEIAGILQRMALRQLVGVSDPEADDAQEIERLAGAASPEFTQLLYQIAIMGRRDLPLAPEPRSGFEMSVLRMLAFRPVSAESRPGPAAAGPVAPRAQSPSPAAKIVRQKNPSAPASASESSPGEVGDWPALVDALGLEGAVRQLATHCALEHSSPFELRLAIERRNAHLLTENLRERLKGALHERLGGSLKIEFVVSDSQQDTLAARQAEDARADSQRQHSELEGDENVQAMMKEFQAEIVPGSVKPSRRTRGSGAS